MAKVLRAGSTEEGCRTRLLAEVGQLEARSLSGLGLGLGLEPESGVDVVVHLEVGVVQLGVGVDAEFN